MVPHTPNNTNMYPAEKEQVVMLEKLLKKRMMNYCSTTISALSVSGFEASSYCNTCLLSRDYVYMN